jgi:hypothetical protein
MRSRFCKSIPPLNALRLMPFQNQTPRPFTQLDIQMLKPGQIGVYGIYRNGLWVYIGQGDIKNRLLDHVNGDNPTILLHKPTHWVAEITPYPLTREKELIIECRPIANKKIG